MQVCVCQNTTPIHGKDILVDISGFWFLLIFFAIINNVMNILMHVCYTTQPIISINHKPKSDISM